LSAIIFLAYRGVLREPFFANLKQDLPHLWAESRGVAVAFVSIPALAFLLHSIFMQNLGIAEIGRVVDETVQEWKAAPKFDFVAKPSLSSGPTPESAALTLVEFADFRCGHCKRASFSLHAFVNAHPDVRFEFYSFPLDGACNEKIETSSGISCRLAATVYCAAKSGKGWEAHDALFAAQDEVNQLATTPELDVLLSKQMPTIGLNWESLQTCVNDSSTMDAIRAQAKQGALVNVQGTPTLFANGKLISRVLVPVLQKAREASLKN
jgi:protein-disulfide isomerase